MANTNWILPVRYASECCPDCGDEIDVMTDGSSNCDVCGHMNVLPCNECLYGNDDNIDVCDWTENGCYVTRHMKINYMSK